MQKHSHSGSSRRYQPRGTDRLRSTPAGGRPTAGPVGMAGLAAQNPAGLGRHAGSSSMATAANSAHKGFTGPGTALHGPAASDEIRSSTLAQVLATGQLGLRDGND